MRTVFFQFALLLTFSATTYGQTLADVLSSIQERRQVFSQRRQVEAHLRQTTSPWLLVDIPSQSLINWEGLGSIYPTDSNTAGLGIEARITLLNQAIRELRTLQPIYLNFRKEDVEVGNKAGAMRPYMLEDFPDPGRAVAENYHQVLRLVAQSVRRLSVMEWPLAGLKNKRTTPFDGNPYSVQNWECSKKDSIYDQVLIERSFWKPTRTREDYYYSDVTLLASIPGTPDQITGKLAVVFRNQWSPIAWDLGYSVSNTLTSWEPNDGSYQVALSVISPSGSQTMPSPTISLGIAINTIPDYNGQVYNIPYPAGYVVTDPWGYTAPNTWEDHFSLVRVLSSPPPSPEEGTHVMSRRMHALFAPQFVKGLDAPGKSLRLDQSERVTAEPSGDASPLLHPSPGMLMGIPLGVGMDGAAMGYIGIAPGEVDNQLIKYSSTNFLPQITYSFPDAHPIPSRGQLASRFDYAASLRFFGPVQDFHVVYETRREANMRGAALPTLVPTLDQIIAMGFPINYNTEFFFRNWDLPRLKQVVSRDFIVNITPKGHYKNEVKIYRRPIDAAPVDRTPGMPVTDLSGAVLIRTLVLENPDMATNPYPASLSPEKLHITDNSKVYKIWRTGYPAAATKTPSGSGMIHPDIHFKIEEGVTERYAKIMDFQGIGHVTSTTSLEGVTVSAETINDQDWAWYLGMEPLNRSIVRGSQTTVVANTFADNPYPDYTYYFNRFAWHPLTSTITISDEPDITLNWNTSGRLTSREEGKWKTDFSIESGALKAESKFKESQTWDTYATSWTEWSDNAQTIKTYTAPDGLSAKDGASVETSELVLGDAVGNGLPGLPHLLTRKDGSKMAWTWTVQTDGATTVEVGDGILSGNTVTNGTREVFQNNKRGYFIGTQTYLVKDGVSLQTSGTTVPTNQWSSWGAPTEFKDYTTLRSATRGFDGAFERISSTTDLLGNTTVFSGFDAFDRPAGLTWNGNTGNATYNQSGLGYSYNINVAGRANGMSRSWDAAGRMTGGSNSHGQTHPFTQTHSATARTLTHTNAVTGATHTNIANVEDGSLSSATGSTLAFGGLSGSGLSVDEGVLHTRTELVGLTSRFNETWTDAWGRTRKTKTVGTAGGDDITQLLYNPADSAIKRVEIQHPSGKRMIEESEPWHTTGIVQRSGFDLDKNGQLDGSDRFVTTTTAINGVNIRTTITQTGNSTALMVRDYNPSNGITITTLNGGEDVVTETPDFAAKTSEIKHRKFGVVVSTKNITLNHLGQTDQEVVSGTGIPTTNINPTLRADGSVEAVSVTIGGAEATASFAQNGTLSAMTHPLLGNLPVSHGFANGTETLAVNGTTSSQSLDGTASSLSGDGVMAHSRSTVIEAGNFEHTIDPTTGTGASTTLISNAAGAKVLHQYAAGANPTMSWFPGGLLKDVSLGRGGALDFGYTNDGAKDLASITWPDVSSAGFPDVTFYGGSIAMSQRDAAGNVTTLVDPSGTRQLAYEKNRITSTDWQLGDLNPYKVVREYDANGRTFKVALHRNSSVIHEITPTYTGESRETSGVTASGFAAALTRDATSRHITGLTRGGVTQSWGRGTAGRITAAGNNVSGAPTFTYSSFDTKGRRKSVETNRGTWFYDYRGGVNGDGQLETATNSTLYADYDYNFDDIGRRPQFAGNANALNQFVALENALTPKNLYITADPNARLWVNNTEMTPFAGGWTYSLGHPGPTGGWVPWTVKGVLEGAGDVGAFDDAVAVKSGLTWFPPQFEEFTFDDDGNRESSALWNYGWDGRNRLVRARTKTWDTAPQGWGVKFDYDAEGRRFKKEISRYENGSPVEQKVVYFVWDGWDLLYERHEDIHGNPLFDRKYVWGPDIADGQAGGAGGLLLIREKRGTTTKDYYPLYDGTGHLTGLTDSVGNLVAEYWYGPFGELLEAKGEMADANPFRYATKYFDSETGLYYFGHRYYDPASGQWLSREILGEDESLALYGYCHSDPINRVDVMGLKERSLIYQFFFGLDPIVLERKPTADEQEQIDTDKADQIKLMMILREIARGEMDTGMFPKEQKEAVVAEFQKAAKKHEEWLKKREEYERTMLAHGTISSPDPGISSGDVATSLGSPSMAQAKFYSGINADFLMPTEGFTLLLKPGSGLLKALLRVGSEAKVEPTVLKAFNPKIGVTFDGTIYRSPYPGIGPKVIDKYNVAAIHRYSAPREGALYFSTNRRTVVKELGGSLDEGRTIYSFDVKIDNLLDLSNPSVRSKLGVSLDDIVRRSGDKTYDYAITQELGKYARQQDFSGIIAPSARADGGLNLILFQAP